MESWGVRLTWIDCKSYSTFNVSDSENAKFITLTLLCPRGVGTPIPPIPGMGEEGVGKGRGLEFVSTKAHHLRKKIQRNLGKIVAHGEQMQVKSGFINK